MNKKVKIKKFHKKKITLKTKKLKKKLPKNLLKFKKLLIQKREDLLKVILKKKCSDLPYTEIGDEIDVASQSAEKEMLFEVNDYEKSMLENIEHALKKIEELNFGICELCKKRIPSNRLKAMPWARYCVSCQNKFE